MLQFSNEVSVVPLPHLRPLSLRPTTYTRAVRGSIIFRDLAGLTKGASILLAGFDDAEAPLQVIRTKDRVSNPLASGYRDVLVNVVVSDTEGLVAELQLHLYDIMLLKPAVHKTYKLFRAVGLDQASTRKTLHNSLSKKKIATEEVETVAVGTLSKCTSPPNAYLLPLSTAALTAVYHPLCSCATREWCFWLSDY